MTQTEFELKLKEMRAKKAEELHPLQVMIEEIKERQAAKKQLLHEIHEQFLQLERERMVISKRMQTIINDYSERIGIFIRDNYTETCALENTSEWALVKELSKRGYCGRLEHAEKSGEFVDRLNKYLNCREHEDAQTKDEEQAKS
ncbi:MAG: hypothetical protein K6G08_07180 [Prevotella sp.]|nr:hypothetical protein [Prevotella sp.]